MKLSGNSEFANLLEQIRGGKTQSRDVDRLALVGDSLLSLLVRVHVSKEHTHGELEFPEIMRADSYCGLGVISPSNLWLSELYDMLELPGVTPKTTGKLEDTKRGEVHMKGTILEALVGAIYLDSGRDLGYTELALSAIFGDFIERRLTKLKEAHTPGNSLRSVSVTSKASPSNTNSTLMKNKAKFGYVNG